MYRIVERLPTVSEYQNLRSAVGWDPLQQAACRTALETTVFAVVASCGERAVGMARLVGDRTLYLLIVDVVVHPDHQREGLGRRIVGRLVRWVRAQGTRHTLLVAAADVVPFYTALGFSPGTNRLMTYGSPASPGAPASRPGGSGLS